ncbi:uncharacterized protein LOC120217084 [Hibiscus syriacus]|uniref:uncharacterized protein LOC120217084 n=1 Tax=Hibiscus syriacus TaxID=106335 RepID=UPI0019239B3F|nr:uncharacterized protein LOC120217084 [Hibiscus syriacus]
MCKRLRQGDPLSSFLFILVTKALQLMLAKAEDNGAIGGIANVIPNQSFTHLQFADDTIIFLKAREDFLVNVKDTRCFELFSGLSINFSKSVIIGCRVEEAKLQRLASICECQVGKFHRKYLRIPLGADPRHVDLWEKWWEKYEQNYQHGKEKRLSFAARVVLINPVLSALPVYFMSLFEVPKTIVLQIKKIKEELLVGIL